MRKAHTYKLTVAIDNVGVTHGAVEAFGKTDVFAGTTGTHWKREATVGVYKNLAAVEKKFKEIE